MQKTEQKKRITFILPSLTAGGAERVLITLANGLDNNKFEKNFIIISEQGTLKELIAQNIPVNILGKSSVIKAMPKLYVALKNNKPDVIVTTMAHMNFTALLLKPMFPNTKFIVREAITPSFLLKKYKRLGFVIRFLYKFLYKKADLVLSPSQIILDEFETDLRIKALKTQILDNSVNEEDVHAKITITEDEPTTLNFVAAGRLHYQKGFDRLIETLANAHIEYDWRLNILGEGSERENLQNLIKKHNLEDKITLKGLVEYPYNDFAAADCFLLPSRFEGLPNVVLESLACGTPVISMSEAGGVAEIKASPESLIIVNTMSDFKNEIEKIAPQAISKQKPSLLPEDNKYKNVINTFEKLINSITQQ